MHHGLRHAAPCTAPYTCFLTASSRGSSRRVRWRHVKPRTQLPSWPLPSCPRCTHRPSRTSPQCCAVGRLAPIHLRPGRTPLLIPHTPGLACRAPGPVAPLSACSLCARLLDAPPRFAPCMVPLRVSLRACAALAHSLFVCHLRMHELRWHAPPACAPLRVSAARSLCMCPLPACPPACSLCVFACACRPGTLHPHVPAACASPCIVPLGVSLPARVPPRPERSLCVCPRRPVCP